MDTPAAAAGSFSDHHVYDYIIVGGGSAGCIAAAELASDPQVRVLVLEAGGAAEENPETLVADQYKDAFINEDLMWERFSVPQEGCRGHRLFMGSGRGVGGSGAINAMVYTRGSAFDYSMWDVAGWRWPDVVPAFEALERRLQIARKPPTRFTEACIAAAEDAGFSRKDDLNDGTLSGFLGYEWMNAAGNQRRSSYVAFLLPLLTQPNVVLSAHASVQRVLFDANRAAVGVEYAQYGQIIRARATREVILCAGALESPKLLMLSGIGPGRELCALGIPVVADSPGVGRNLMDHPNVSVFFRGKQPTDCTWAQLYGFHRANAATALPEGEADTCYVFYSARSSFREGLIRLLPSMILPMSLYRLAPLPRLLRSGIKGAFASRAVQKFVERMYGVVVILGKPQSRGTVKLASAHAHDDALIDPNYFGAPEDLETLVKGVQLARKIAGAPALSAWGNLEVIPGAWVKSENGIASFVQKNAMTTYHFAGTCRLGHGSEAVVTPRLEVRGVSQLRVADASVIPSVPVSAMNAPSMMIGFRAAEFIKEDRVLGSRPRDVAGTRAAEVTIDR